MYGGKYVMHIWVAPVAEDIIGNCEHRQRSKTVRRLGHSRGTDENGRRNFLNENLKVNGRLRRRWGSMELQRVREHWAPKIELKLYRDTDNWRGEGYQTFGE